MILIELPVGHFKMSKYGPVMDFPHIFLHIQRIFARELSAHPPPPLDSDDSVAFCHVGKSFKKFGAF